MSFIIAQVFGLAGLVGTIGANYQNKKNRVLILQIIANLLCLIQYILLNALAAITSYAVAVVRCLVFYFFDKKGKI